MIYEMHSEVKLALIQECKQHPVLTERLAQYQAGDWGGALGEIAAFVMVVMDGNYMPHELEHLYVQLTFKLRNKRQIIINTVEESRNE